MIEQLTAEDGSTILRKDGRLLASRFEPRQEAMAWVDRRMDLLNQVKTAVVLGVGCGYHLVELSHRFSGQILVVEPSAQLLEQARGIHGFEEHRFLFEICENVKTLRASKKIREAVRGSFVVLIHPPSAVGLEKIFAEFQGQLLGRDWGSLTWQWQLQGFESLEKQPRVTAEKLTIYDLEQTELVQNSNERERLLIQALRELVK